MPKDATTAQFEPPNFGWTSPGAAENDDGLAAMAWWLTGGVSLLLWTGLALLLTTA